MTLVEVLLLPVLLLTLSFNTENKNMRPGAMAHSCNPIYPVGRDKGDRSLKPAKMKSLQDRILKNTFTKKGLVKWLKV
jgi:hypothetical protein